MAYGIQGTTASGGFLIDSDTTATEYLTVVSSGTLVQVYSYRRLEDAYHRQRTVLGHIPSVVED